MEQAFLKRSLAALMAKNQVRAEQSKHKRVVEQRAQSHLRHKQAIVNRLREEKAASMATVTAKEKALIAGGASARAIAGRAVQRLSSRGPGPAGAAAMRRPSSMHVRPPKAGSARGGGLAGVRHRRAVTATETVRGAHGNVSVPRLHLDTLPQHKKDSTRSTPAEPRSNKGVPPQSGSAPHAGGVHQPRLPRGYRPRTPPNVWKIVDKQAALEERMDKARDKAMAKKRTEDLRAVLVEQERVKAEKLRKQLEWERRYAEQERKQREKWKIEEAEVAAKLKAKADHEKVVRAQQMDEVRRAKAAKLARDRVEHEQLLERFKIEEAAAKKKVEDARLREQRRVAEVVAENDRQLIIKQAAKAKEAEEEAKVLRIAEEMAEKREAARKAEFEEMYAQQERLVNLGLFAQESMADKIKDDERRAAAWIKHYEAIKDAELAERAAKERRMVEEQKIMLDEQMIHVERERKRAMEADIKAARIAISADKKAAEDDVVAAVKVREKSLAHRKEVERQIRFDRMKKKHGKAVGSMTTTELVLNRSIIARALQHGYQA